MFLPSNITLQFGDSGDFVSELQRRLTTVNAHSAEAISGFYDGNTVNSVTAFQTRSGLRADGVAGPETLRRLNGVISGDTSGSDSKKEEEARHASSAPVMPEPRPIENPVPMQTLTREAEPAANLSSAVAPVSEPAIVRAPEPVREPQQPAPVTAGDLLAQMLLQTAAAPSAKAPEPSAREAAAARAAEHQPAHATTHASAGTAQTAAPKDEKSPGLIGRAMQKIDSFVQRMAEYFEAKLPPDVLREVRHLGQTMLQNGVREAAIPTGPEQARGQAPARGPEQQPQIPHRG